MGSSASAGIEARVRAALVFDLAWASYEPNAEPLWARVREAASNVLIAYWRNGELVGTKPEEAFFVRCGRDTMTQQDLGNGRLIVLVGIAPLQPAEFVVIRIEQIVSRSRRHWSPRRWLGRIRYGAVKP